ncbi:uncharacterized protein Z518_01792 [Rhinocladiella mackenziei CBS 650.93]|uniref:Rhinocladiella mackenziei CBS 650.93 unplaced genomic scaffold supercont1.1, whole genome shotgun sequence n=1 Tax=Rhinocladiella mackenziei CBS 650.93 TaxID=1442369 RepID=A0A0D2HJ59_9EURO|nr:uncharacterized protein Z518_01792 [Rhinocladiella mackenziei CBS 650.93]KIX10708.1 hypothetical protein Z518_01792 [Rhinocladiella mackenziei CBS 650.93]
MAHDATRTDILSGSTALQGVPHFTTSHIVLAVLTVLLTSKWYSNYQKRVKVPGIGYSAWPILSSWIAAFKFMRSPVELTRQGIEKHNRGFFRISTLQGEYVLIAQRDKIAEYVKAPDDVLGFQEAANDQQQIEYTMGFGVAFRTYHTPVVRIQLTQSLKTHIPAMMDEMSLALDDMIGSPSEFQQFALYDIIAMAVARTSSRVFVGPILSRNKEYLENAINYAAAVVISAELVRMFPPWLKSILIKVAPVTWYRRRSLKFLRHIIQDRLDGKLDENGQKPDDLIQWLVDAAPPIERTIPQLAERIMALNVASIHTTTMTLSGALYCLAAEPEKYTAELRAEVLEHAPDGNITKDTLVKLVKMDSFLREAGRFNNAGLLSMQRNAKKKFTFSDGTVIPPGAKVGTPLLFVHRDPALYDNPEVFDGFRFSRLRENAETGQAIKYTMISTDPAYQLFGHGKHACPGRFFAVTEMKLLFSLILLRYDLALEPGTGPKPIYVATMCLPDTKLKVLMKKAVS